MQQQDFSESTSLRRPIVGEDKAQEGSVSDNSNGGERDQPAPSVAELLHRIRGLEEELEALKTVTMSTAAGVAASSVTSSAPVFAVGNGDTQTKG